MSFVKQDLTFSVHSEEALQQFDRIVRSTIFQKAARSKRLLEYLVHASTSTPPSPVKEYILALEVFDRGSNYDPSVDATVRVEASRLRGRLREYYGTEGQHDEILIEMPKGGYTLVFLRREALSAEAVMQPADTPSALLPEPAVAPAPRLRAWTLGLAFASLAALSAVVAVGWRAHARPAPVPIVPVRVQSSTLAVLPIVNQSGDSSLDRTMDGLTDDIIRQLSSVQALHLMAHSSVFRYRTAVDDPVSVGRSLGVRYVATSHLRRSPQDDLALAVEVTETATGMLVLNREYLVDRRDFEDLQAKVQRDILTALHAEDSARDPGRTGRLTDNSRAYDQFLIGDALARSGSPANLHLAIEHFGTATALDPQFDLAWSALADAHVLLGLYTEAPGKHMPLAREYAQTALRLNPGLLEAHGALGIIDLVYDWNPATARGELASTSAQQAAIATFSCVAHLIERAGQPRTAEEMLLRMRTYDPQSSDLTAELGCVDYYRGDYHRAIDFYHEAIQSDPLAPVSYWGLGKALVALHRPQEALDALRSFRLRNGQEPALITAELGYTLGSMGRKQEAVAQARLLLGERSSSFVDPFLIALVYSSIGDRDATYHWLDSAFEIRSPFLISLATDHQWDRLREEPRFQLIERRVTKSARP